MSDSKLAGAKKTFVIIDGKSVFYRGYYAMPNLSTKGGLPTGGVFGFAVLALEVIKKLKPDYVAVAWDKPKTNIRKRLELYSEYKAGRKSPPPDFYEQVPVLHELLKAFGWPLYELDDYEADDIMGALAGQASKEGIETLLVTSDLDMLQVIDEHIHVFILKRGLSEIELYSPKSFEAKYGLKVDQFLDFKSIKGDSSDNIPGVPGIGEKGAIELLTQFKTLDGIYNNLPLIKNSLRDKLVAGKDMAYLSKKLARIWTDAPIKLKLEEVDGSKIQPTAVTDMLKKLEFHSLLRQLPEAMQVAIEGQQTTNTTKLKAGKNILIDNDAKLEQIKLAQSDQLFIYSRAAGQHGREPRVLAVSADGLTVYTIDLTKVDKSKLAKLFSQKSLVGYDVKTSLKLLINLGIDNLPPVGHDVLIGAFILNSLRREKTLTDLAQADLGYGGSSLEELDDQDLMSRAAEVIVVIKNLYEQQAEDFAKAPSLDKLAKTIEWPVIPVLARMEYVGIQLDTNYLHKMNSEIDLIIADIEKQIFESAGEHFNIGSTGQLADILFGKTHLGLSTTGVKKGKTSFSTASNELDKLRGKHPIIDLITKWREVTKLKNTYVDTLPKLVDGQSRLHTTFSLTVAQTGRLSSADPNLQNIPVRTDLGKRIRTAFVAAKGNKLVSADYSQFELRLSAAMSNDQDLIDMFNKDVDVHAATAAQVYHREPEDITKQMRRTAKAVNFGILYGMGPHGLTVATGMSYEQAQHFINEYNDLRKPLIAYLEKLKEQARREGYVETLFGRRRPMPDINSSNFVVRAAAERAAMNMPIQGTEADLMKMAMVKADNLLRKRPEACVQLLQIHDSILVECPEGVADEIAELLKETMENIYPELKVKLTVDTTIGQNWGDL
jgi:DNA polymerase-1